MGDTVPHRPWYISFGGNPARRSSLLAQKLYIFEESSRDEGPSVFWEIRTIVGALEFSGKTFELGRWWSRAERAASLPGLLTSGLKSEDVRPSLKAYMASNNAADDGESSEDAAASGSGAIASQWQQEVPPRFLTREYMMSSAAMLVLRCRWSASGPLPRRKRASAILHDVFAVVMGSDAADYRTALGLPERALQLECSRPSKERNACRHCADIELSVGDVTLVASATAQWQCQTSLLQELFQTRSRCALIDEWWMHLIPLLAGLFDELISTGQVGQPTPELLPQPRGALKRRRLELSLHPCTLR